MIYKVYINMVYKVLRAADKMVLVDHLMHGIII